MLAVLTGFIATLKDTVTDPLRSTLSSVWIWTDGGQYFGVPIHNFFGWFFVFFVMTMVVDHLSLFSKSNKLKADKNFLLFPVVLFTLQAIMAIIANMNVPETQKALGQVGSYMGLFALTPFILLAWLNTFKKEKA